MRCFRMNPAGDDPSRLLREEGQWTEPWGSSEDGSPCDKCNGTGATRFECWSCLLTGARQSCPVCSGRVRWTDRCPVCRGSRRVDGKPRHGVSVFPAAEGLYHYMLVRGTELEGCTIVELDAAPAGDVDFDADEGAMLVLPIRVIGCASADPEIASEVQRRAEEARAA